MYKNKILKRNYLINELLYFDFLLFLILLKVLLKFRPIARREDF